MSYTREKVLIHVRDLAIFIRDARNYRDIPISDEQIGYWAWNDWFFLEFR